MSLKVLHVIPSLSPVHGGPTRALELMETVLPAAGINMTTATTDDAGPGRRLQLSPGAGTSVAGTTAAGTSAAGTSAAGTMSQMGASRKYFRKSTEFYKFAPGFAWWIWRQVREYDLVHIHALFSFTSTVAALAARWHQVPYVIRPLGTLTEYGVTQRRPWLKKISLACIEAPILRHASAVHFTSVAEQQEAERLGIVFSPVVLPLGVEPSEAGSAERLLAAFPLPVAARLVFLSRIDPKKNLEGLIAALPLLLAAGQQVSLLVGGAGDPVYVAALKKYAADTGVADRVVWLGYVSGQLKADLLAAGDLYVLPSFSENFGIAAVEALAAGLPCILGKGVALAEAVVSAGAGISIEPEPQYIAEGIRSLLADDDLRRHMSKNAGMLAAQQFSAAAMGRNLVELYERISNSAREPQAE